jgi:hypothetical protein
LDKQCLIIIISELDFDINEGKEMALVFNNCLPRDLFILAHSDHFETLNHISLFPFYIQRNIISKGLINSPKKKE